MAASTGNHGQSVAYAARLFGCKATVFMPEAANRLKVQATVALGSKVIETGRDFDAARVAAEEYAASHGSALHSLGERATLGCGSWHRHSRIARGRRPTLM